MRASTKYINDLVRNNNWSFSRLKEDQVLNVRQEHALRVANLAKNANEMIRDMRRRESNGLTPKASELLQRFVSHVRVAHRVLTEKYAAEYEVALAQRTEAEAALAEQQLQLAAMSAVDNSALEETIAQLAALETGAKVSLVMLYLIKVAYEDSEALAHLGEGTFNEVKEQVQISSGVVGWAYDEFASAFNNKYPFGVISESFNQDNIALLAADMPEINSAYASFLSTGEWQIFSYDLVDSHTVNVDSINTAMDAYIRKIVEGNSNLPAPIVEVVDAEFIVCPF